MVSEVHASLTADSRVELIIRDFTGINIRAQSAKGVLEENVGGPLPKIPVTVDS